MSLEYVIQKARNIPIEPLAKHRQRVYSCLVNKRGRIISESPCLYEKSHPMQQEYSVRTGYDSGRCMMHSELRSIILAMRHKPKNLKLCIARVGKSGAILDAAPCRSCALAIRECGFITSIEYTIGM